VPGEGPWLSLEQQVSPMISELLSFPLLLLLLPPLSPSLNR
jgi:hypothetical protein